jgi:hypothetical protein
MLSEVRCGRGAEPMQNTWIVYGLSKPYSEHQALNKNLVLQVSLGLDNVESAKIRAGLWADQNNDPAIVEFWLFNEAEPMPGRLIPVKRSVPPKT